MSEGPVVTFLPSGRSEPWRDDFFTLLELAESCGLTPAFSCRVGVCGTCRVTLVSGDLQYVLDPLDPPEAGQMLLCCTQPLGDVTVRL